MFLFGACCAPCEPTITGPGYELQKSNNVRDFVTTLKEVDPHELKRDEFKVVKMRKSDFETLHHDHCSRQAKFRDSTFPPEDLSLGEIAGIDAECKWKRIPDIIQNPVLMGPRIEPSHVIQGNLGNCYFLSALAALAQKPERLRRIFGEQQYNKEGIYNVPVRVNGEVEEVIVDDYIPVNGVGEPIFSQPNRNEFWVLILEKVWAKINGSYANIVVGMPSQVLKTFTFAPTDMRPIKDTNEERERLWMLLSQYTKNEYPICCTTGEDILKTGNLAQGHSYTLLDTAWLEDIEGVHHKVVKLRDPWGKNLWDGLASDKDATFWGRILNDSARKKFENKPQTGTYGVFYMAYSQFCQYFTQFHYCLMHQAANYTYESLFVNPHNNGTLFELQVYHKGFYTIQLHQSKIDDLSPEQRREQGISRAALILARANGHDQYQFLEGVLKYNEEDTKLTLEDPLESGRYLILAVLDPTRTRDMIPKQSSVSVYSQNYTCLLPAPQNLRKQDFLKSIFLRHGRHFKKNEYNNKLMWISSKLMFQQGGYAYIAIGNDPKSNKKFVINFDENQFEKVRLELEGQFSGAGSHKLEVYPGQERVIVARVKNELVKHLKFPPNMGIKLQLMPQT